MIEFEKEFQRYVNQYLGKECVDNYIPYADKAKDLISDIKYFTEHIARYKRTKGLSFEVMPRMNGVIMDSFICQMFRYYHQNHWLNEDMVIKYLQIYEVTFRLFNQCWLGGQVDLVKVKELVEWGKIVSYYTGLDIQDHISSFNGPSYSCRAIREAWKKCENSEEGI